MSALTQDKAKNAFIQLSQVLASPNDHLENVIFAAQNKNAWFSVENVKQALNAIAKQLNEIDLNTWFNTIQFSSTPKKIGLILAGNIPLVGFHDVLCVLASGNIALIKLSSADDQLKKPY